MRAKLEVWEKTFTQDADTCSGDGTQSLRIEQDDGGGGPFWILNTQRWAFDSIEELVELLRAAGVAETATEEVA